MYNYVSSDINASARKPHREANTQSRAEASQNEKNRKDDRDGRLGFLALSRKPIDVEKMRIPVL